MAFTMELNLPTKEEVIETNLKLSEETNNEIMKAARQQVTELLATDIEGVEGRRSVSQVIESYGMDTAKRVTRANALLSSRIGDLQSQGGQGELVASTLNQLDDKLKALDPSAVNFLPRKFIFDGKGALKKYFRKYEKSDAAITEILDKLKKGQTVLHNDNVTLEIEQQQIRETTKALGSQIEMGTCMDTLLEEELSKLRALGNDPDRVTFIEEEVLYPLRQRVTDLQAIQAVNYQSYFSMEVTRKSNLELIRSVDRVQLLTKTALQTAVMLANALYHQKVVLGAVHAVKESTNQLIASNSKLMKEHGVAIQMQAAESLIDPETLRQAFQDVFSALDDASAYKASALPKLKATMLEFKQMADDGEKRIIRIENGLDAT